MKFEFGRGKSPANTAIVRADFPRPDFTRAFDLAAELAVIPAEATVRGMFMGMVDDFVKEKTGKSIRTDDTPAFGTVPTRLYVALVAGAAELVFPGVPTREGIRRLGQRVFDDFYATMIGKAIFAVGGRDFQRLGTLAPKAYEVAYSPASARVVVKAPGHLHVTFAPMFVLPETFHVGAWEGAARFCGGTADVLVSAQKVPGHVEYDILYTPG